MLIPDLVQKAKGGFAPVLIHRQDPVHPPHAFEQFSDRRLVPVQVQEAPRPVPYTAYYGVGRDQAHARPTIWQYNSLAIPEILSVMGWPFGVKRIIKPQHPDMPRGRQTALSARVNIDNPQQTALGSLTTLGGTLSYSPELAKITF